MMSDNELMDCKASGKSQIENVKRKRREEKEVRWKMCFGSDTMQRLQLLLSLQVGLLL